MPKIEVTSLPETFRRAGLKFTREPRQLKVDAKTLKVLAGEPNLKVISLPEEKPAEPKKAAATGKAKAAPEAADKTPKATTSTSEKSGGDS